MKAHISKMAKVKGWALEGRRDVGGISDVQASEAGTMGTGVDDGWVINSGVDSAGAMDSGVNAGWVINSGVEDVGVMDAGMADGWVINSGVGGAGAVDVDIVAAGVAEAEGWASEDLPAEGCAVAGWAAEI
eukprot:gene15363-biopygen24405